jgi:hypothetical protein
MPKGSDSASTSKRKKADRQPSFHRATSPAWMSFSKRLITALQKLEVGQWLIIQKQGALDWVQYAVEGSGKLRVETKSNHYRNLEQELSLEQQEVLSRIGWLLPSGSGAFSTPPNDPYGSPNYWLDLTLPVQASTLVNVTVATFTDVYRVSEPDGLLYEAFFPTGDSLSLPDLGLKPLITTRDNSQNPQLRSQLLEIIKEITETSTFAYDSDGDIGPIRFGCVNAFVRLVEDQPYMRLYAPVLDDVDQSPELLSRINELNCSHGFLHLCVLNDCLTVVSDVLIAPFLTRYVAQGLGNFLQLADEFASELREEFGCYTPSNQRLVTH